MTDYTIITTDAELQVDADRYRKDEVGDLYCYDTGGDAVAHVEAGRFVAIFETDRGIVNPSLT